MCREAWCKPTHERGPRCVCHKKAPLCLAMHMAGLRQLAARNEVVPVNDIMDGGVTRRRSERRPSVEKHVPWIVGWAISDILKDW